HPAVDGHHTAALPRCLFEGLDDPAGPGDLFLGGGEDAVARFDLPRVDQRLAVEAELAALYALGLEARQVLHVVVDAVEDHLAGRVDLRDDHRGRTGRRRGTQVVLMPRGVDAVDSDGDLAVAILTGAGGGTDPLARVDLGVRRHGVLEVEDQRVRGKRLGLL